jgi:chromosomal replication initiation ATPase DnaA
MLDWLAEAQDRRGRLAVIEGSGGIGKTHLLAAGNKRAVTPMTCCTPAAASWNAS